MNAAGSTPRNVMFIAGRFPPALSDDDGEFRGRLRPTVLTSNARRVLHQSHGLQAEHAARLGARTGAKHNGGERIATGRHRAPKALCHRKDPDEHHDHARDASTVTAEDPKRCGTLRRFSAVTA